MKRFLSGGLRTLDPVQSPLLDSERAQGRPMKISIYDDRAILRWKIAAAAAMLLRE
jgi:hypothetical protein